jgi:hypothetical protein
MSGSSVKFSLPDGLGNKHTSLGERNAPLQHNLESIYRETDGANLAQILREMSERDTSVKWEMFVLDNDTTTINLTAFQFNMARDDLWVTIQGVNVYEGSDKDYVKTSGTQIQFNYLLKKGYEVVVILAGTKSNVSFGDDIYNALNRFTQLTDTPSNYYGKGGKFVRVNDSETGLVYGEAIANTNLNKIEYDVTVPQNSSIDRWIPFVRKGIIKGIKVTGTQNTGDFTLSIWTKVNGYWVYYSGRVTNILWDIMDIPFIDESGQDSIYIRLNNQGPESKFHLQIYIVQ